MKDFVELFWSKVNKTEACWVWTGGKCADGYGSIRSLGKVTGTHRISWELENGPIPRGLHVLHKCDNPSCVRPDHLFLGTHKQNMDDRNAKGRARGGSRPGESSGHNVLKESDVIEIRRLVSLGMRQDLCANAYCVSKATVNDLVLRKTWRHVA